MDDSNRFLSKSPQNQNEALNLAKKVFEVLDIFWFTLVLVFVLVLWALAYIVLFAIGAMEWYGVYPMMILIMVGMLFFATIRLKDIVDGIRTLKDWKKRYLSYAFLNVFEFSPRTNPNMAEEIVERLRAIYPDVDKELRKDPEAASFNEAIEGKKGRKYSFDVVVYLPYSLVVVRFRPGGIPLDAPDVKEFCESIAGVINDTDLDILQAIIVSDGGFTEQAIDYASSKDNWPKQIGGSRVSPTLLKVTEERYQIEWLQAMQQSVPG